METIKTQIQQIVISKLKIKKDLYNLRNHYIVACYEGLATNKPIKQIHKELYDMTINAKKQNLPTSKKMLASALLLSKRAKKQIPIGTSDVIKNANNKFGNAYGNINYDLGLSLLAFNLIETLNFESTLTKEINIESNKIESESKETAMQESIKENRKLENPKIFYLASSHDDSALDHEDYQKLMYVDEKWEYVIKDKELKSLVNDYINENDVKTIQWVMGEPVWFITRPNCRHYFKALPVDEVLENDIATLIRNHGMHRPIGDRQYLQTLRGSKSKNDFERKRNAELILAKYEERLRLYLELYKTKKSPLIKKAIEKVKMLIAKWKEYLSKF